MTPCRNPALEFDERGRSKVSGGGDRSHEKSGIRSPQPRKEEVHWCRTASTSPWSAARERASLVASGGGSGHMRRAANVGTKITDRLNADCSILSTLTAGSRGARCNLKVRFPTLPAPVYNRPRPPRLAVSEEILRCSNKPLWRRW